MIEVKQGELEQLGTLLNEHGIEALIARHKPQTVEVRFNVQWLDRNSLAASFRRVSTAGPYFITLSPLLLEWGLTDRIAFSTIILHELGHVIDRVKNWTRYDSIDTLHQPDDLEYEADDFVVACGWKDGLIETLRQTITREREHGMPEGMISKRLSRLSAVDLRK
jgi:hypothetical protein